MIFNILAHATGVLLLVDILSIAYNLATRHVTLVRRRMYWLKLPLSAVLFGVYLNFVINQIWNVRFLEPTPTRYALIFSLFLLGLMLAIVTYTDRREYEQITGLRDGA